MSNTKNAQQNSSKAKQKFNLKKNPKKINKTTHPQNYLVQKGNTPQEIQKIPQLVKFCGTIHGTQLGIEVYQYKFQEEDIATLKFAISCKEQF